MLLFPKEPNSFTISCETLNPTEEPFWQGRAKSAPRNVTRGHGEDRTLSHHQTPIPCPAFAPQSDSVVPNEISFFVQNCLVFVYGKKGRRRKNRFSGSQQCSRLEGNPPPLTTQKTKQQPRWVLALLCPLGPLVPPDGIFCVSHLCAAFCMSNIK